MDAEKMIRESVHDLYWNNDVNCARTTMLILSQLFTYRITEQLYYAAVGMHGAGKYRAQCGIVEGTLLFLGCYLTSQRKDEDYIVSACYRFAESFENKFGALTCRVLRPIGFNENDPPHACENLTVNAIMFSYSYISGLD